jgi:hypothetical protein
MITSSDNVSPEGGEASKIPLILSVLIKTAYFLETQVLLFFRNWLIVKFKMQFLINPKILE